MKHRPVLLLIGITLLAVSACGAPAAGDPPSPQGDSPPTRQSAEAATPGATASLTPLPPTPTPSPSPTPSLTPSPTPFGCLRPPDAYTRVQIRDMVINQRTLWMLEHAQTLYDGTQDFVKALTQGSYTGGAVAASFGTHDGGGAVDLSVRDVNDWNNILYDELDVMILALRRAGFAAWVREQDELYEGSPLHIHAIAIGDAELSEAAARQLTGPEGYFRGFNGLPVDPPLPDGWGEPVICPWMIEMGYADLRGAEN